jgi:hypothetical protein
MKPIMPPLCAAAALLLAAHSHAQVAITFDTASSADVLFRADAKTVAYNGGELINSPIQTRLFRDNNRAPAPIGTHLWFVADLNNDGVPALQMGAPQVSLSQILGDDDVLMFQDTVDGDQPGSVAGRYRRVGIEVKPLPNSQDTARLPTATFYLFLWDETAQFLQPSLGMTFGIGEIGVRPPPGFGNAFWGISQDIIASQFTVVPEPHAATVFTGALLSAIVGIRLAKRVRLQRLAGA